MKRILFVDYLSPEGHLPPTRTQMESLYSLGYELYTVLREGYYEELGVTSAKKYIEIPSSYYVGIGSHFKSRLSYIKILLYLRKLIKKEEWDYTILQGYEPFSLCLVPIFKDAYIVDHNTVAYLNNPIKRFFLTHIKKSYKHIVFNELMRDALLSNGIRNVAIVPVGMHKIGSINNWDILQILGLSKKKYIFSPSSTSSDKVFVNELCNNDDFYELLKKEDLKFVIKGSYTVPKERQDNIIVVKKYLLSQDYDCLMKESALVFIAYPPTFAYRISGVQLECMASDVKCILSDIPAFRVYERYFCYNHIFFKTINEVIKMIPLAIAENSITLYRDLTEIASPSLAWKKLLA